MSSTEQVFGRGWPGGRSGAATADFIRNYTAGMTHEQRLNQVRFIARLMDDQFALPGTSIRFGLDSILGLVPGLGDALTSAISLLIVHHAWAAGASKLTLARMLGNVGIDLLVGSVPVLGDLFDVAFKANRKNARLLEAHLGKRSARGTVEILPPERRPRRA